MSDHASSSRVPAKAFDPVAMVHPGVRVAAEWMWRLIVIGVGVGALGWLIGELSHVVIPLAVAVLLAGLLTPIVSAIDHLRIPRSLAVIVVLVASLSALGAGLTFIVRKFIEGLPELTNEITQTVDDVRNWLAEGPLHMSDDKITQAATQITDALKTNQAKITEGAFSTATAIGNFFAGMLLTVFILIFLLYGGAQIWQFLTRIVPVEQRARVRLAGQHAFGSLVGLMRATVVVAMVDAIGIGSGLAILQVPLWLPLASLVFLGAFIPIIGAMLTGAVAVLIALVTKGVLTALITFGIIVAVMQLESHVLQPLLLGRAVRIHPLAVVLAIAVGLVLAGIPGALFAVPLVAVLNTGIRTLLTEFPEVAQSTGLQDLVEPDRGSHPDESSEKGEPADQSVGATSK